MVMKTALVSEVCRTLEKGIGEKLEVQTQIQLQTPVEEMEAQQAQA